MNENFAPEFLPFQLRKSGVASFFAQALFAGEMLAPESLQEMLETRSPFGDVEYGLGVMYGDLLGHIILAGSVENSDIKQKILIIVGRFIAWRDAPKLTLAVRRAIATTPLQQ